MIICLVENFPGAYAAVKLIDIIEISFFFLFFCLYSLLLCIDGVWMEAMSCEYLLCRQRWIFSYTVFHLVFGLYLC